MTPRPQSRTITCTRRQANLRLQHAEAFLNWAQAALSDTAADANLNVATSMAVLAGIAASDALCGKALGQYSRSQNHPDAVKLIQSIQPGGAELASTFRQLVGNKDNAQYAPKTMGEASAKAAVRQAVDLVNAARTRP